MSLIETEIEGGAITGNSFELFLSAIPYQFYSILALVTIPLVIGLKLDLFTVRKAEEAAQVVIEQEGNDKEKVMAKPTFIIVPLIVLFAILMPFAIKLSLIANLPIGLLVGAVLSGGLFGDHLSPISDTTILAASGSGIGLLEHVKTQLPYGLINAGVAIICFLGAGLMP